MTNIEDNENTIWNQLYQLQKCPVYPHIKKTCESENELQKSEKTTTK